MKKIKFIKRQDSGFKLSYGNSGETSLNLSNEILDLISRGTLNPGEERDVIFRIFKEDCIKAMSFVIMKLPLYKSSSTYSNKVDNYLEIFGELYSKIESFFGPNNNAEYKVGLFYRPDGRIYLKGLRVKGFSIRDYLVENYSALQFDNEGGDIINLRVLSNIEDNGGYEAEYALNSEDVNDKSLQQIIYGAPGTGKSHRIKDDAGVKAADEQNLVFRTTFHPDSDYSTFVGCYKPLMDKKTSKIPQPILDYDSLVDKFKEYLMVPNVNITKACTLFGYDYHDSIIRIQENGHKVMDLVNDAYKSNTSYDSVVRGGMACYEQNPIKESDSKIIYSFVPQAFTNAYVKAWSTKEDVYLIIEEINRGNCAQIFGDLFQLLDRGGDGRSEYPINADCDLTNYIGKALAESTRDDFPDGVKDGRKLMLPENFYIWATMNTSDQSLFPIDSAFKRRWDWKYIPIEDAGKNWKIKVNSNEYDWYQFLEAINKEVFALTHSEDKQLGYFFAKAKNGIIDAETLVNKVFFYLWMDVFKDYDYESQKAFRKPESNDAISFKDFFANGSVNEAMAEHVLVNLGLEKTEETDE